MKAEIQNTVDKIKGMKVSHIWRGYGSAIFLELGKLTTHPQRNNPSGEITIMIEWSWRVEKRRSILFGSWSSNTKINNQLPKLKGLLIEEVQFVGRIPELELNLENKLWLHSFQTTEPQPDWCILSNGKAVFVERGKIKISDA